nr:hypothetical protein [Tanacetum cinerariifolium]
MTTLAEHIIVVGAENHYSMLEISMYDSWASRICLFIKGKKHGRMMLDSIDNGRLLYPTVEENRQTRPKKYSELTEAQQLQDDCDVQATNIILHGLPPDVLVVPMFQQGEDPIECINKAMTFLSAVASRFPPSNNQLRTSSNPRNQATIQDGRPQFPLNYESKPGYIENYNSYPYDSSSLPQQYPCCTRCGGPHETCQCDQLIFDEPYCKHCGEPHMNFQCQTMNQNFCNPNSPGFDKPQPPQSLVIYQPPQEISIQEMEDLKQQYLDELKRLSNLEYRDEIKIAELTENFNGMSIEIRKKEKLLQLEQWAYLSTHPSKRLNSFCYDEDYTIAVTPVLSTEEPDNSLSMGDEHLDTIPATESDEVIKSSVENLIPIPSESEGIPEHMCDVPFHDNSPPLDVSKDQIENTSESNDEFSLTDDDSFSIDNINYVEASPLDSELVSSEVMEIVIPKVGRIDDDILLKIKDDILREKPLNVNLLIAKTEALNANPTPSSDCKTKSPSTSLNSLLEETNTSDNSLPEFETFCFDVEEIGSGSTTTHSDISLPEYEAFYDDHIKEISSGSPTTHSDSSLYESFIFDLLINPFPPTDRSDFFEFADELIPFISPPEYDCFLFKASPPYSELVSSEVMEIVIPEVGGIDDDILLTIKDDIFREKLLNVNLLIAKIEALNANPTPSFNCKTKSSSTSLNSLLEETNTFDNSLPEFETFCFDVEEISSDSTTTHPDISLPEYEAFYDDHVKEISSGSPTTHFDSSLYGSFIFDLSINPFPPADRSNFYEFSDELIPFISAPEYDCFLFKVEPHSRDFTKDVVEDISPKKEPQVPNTLPTHPTLQLNMKFHPSSESLFTYVIWIFLPFLVYSVAPHYLLSLRNEDAIFDPGICNLTFSRPDISHRCGTVKKFNTHRSHLNKCSIHRQNTPPLDVLLNKMHKAFPLLDESSHWQYNFPLPVEGFPTARRMEIPLLKSL